MKKLTEGLLGFGDSIYAVRFLRLLTMPWIKTGAYKKGIIDKDGNKLRKPETSQEKDVYNTFHKLVFNIRRLIQKIPFIGKSVLTSYAAALFMLKEETGMSDKRIAKVLSQAGFKQINECINQLNEETNTWYINEETDEIEEGVYTLGHDVILGEAETGSLIRIKEHAPIGQIFGLNVYEAYHFKSKQKIYVTNRNITK